MRSAWVVALGLLATAAACGGSDDDPGTDDIDGGGQTSSGTNGTSSSGTNTTSSGSSGATSSGGGSSGATSSGGGSSGATSSSGDVDGGDDEDAGDAGDETDAEVDAGFDAGPSFQYTKFDLNHLLVAGQSNSLGIGGGTVLDTTHRGAPACSVGTLEGCAGLMFSSGVFPSSNCQGDHWGCSAYEARTAFAPAREGDTYFASPNDYALQTPSSPIANQAAQLASSVYFPGIGIGASGVRMLVSNHGRSGTSYICLRKGGCPSWWGGGIPASVKPAFADGIDQVSKAKDIALARGWSYAVRGVFVVHGENNHVDNHNGGFNEFPMNATNGVGMTSDYTGALYEWQRDYETDIKAITGQTVPVPMYITQMVNWTRINGYNASTSDIPQQQLAAFRDRPEKIVLVTPTYAFPFASDGTHLTPEGSRRVGEYFAKAYAETTFAGRPWAPLYPEQVTRAGAVITVRFHVPVAPLTFDTVAVTDPNGKYGFVFSEGGANPATIQTVTIAGDSVQITLNKAPSGANPRIRYASNGTAGANAGPTTGARGNLRDSDDTRAESNPDVRLVNWAVAFDEAVP